MSKFASAAVLIALINPGVSAPTPSQTIQVGRIALELPASFEYEDDEGTLVAWPPGSESIVVRVTVHSVLKEGHPVAGAGVAFVSKQAADEKLTLERKGAAAWYHTEKIPTDGSPPGSLMHFWIVGFEAYVLVVSCYVDASVRDRPQEAEALTQVMTLIASLREVGVPDPSPGP